MVSSRSIRHWLFKSEPDAFSIDDLAKRKNQISSWDGVRNYQARNFMKEMAIGDMGFFYHSSCAQPGIYGMVKVAASAHPDFTALDTKSKYFDPKATKENPRWFMVDVQLVEKWHHPILLSELRENPRLVDMVLLRRGNRLSVLPIEERHWQEILKRSR